MTATQKDQNTKQQSSCNRTETLRKTRDFLVKRSKGARQQTQADGLQWPNVRPVPIIRGMRCTDETKSTGNYALDEIY